MFVFCLKQYTVISETVVKSIVFLELLYTSGIRVLRTQTKPRRLSKSTLKENN